MNLEKIWKRLLKQIIENGREHTKDDSPIREIIGVHEFVPAPTMPGVRLTPEFYLDLVKKGAFDIKDSVLNNEPLHKYVSSFDDQYMIDGGDFVYTYPERLQNYETVDLFGEITTANQYELMIYRLQENAGSNRAVAITINPGRDGVAEDIPCLQFIQALIRDNKLTLTIIFRSNDAYGAWPSNMMFIHYIGISLVEELRKTYPTLEYEGIYYNCSSLHIYETDMPAAEKVVGL